MGAEVEELALPLEPVRGREYGPVLVDEDSPSQKLQQAMRQTECGMLKIMIVQCSLSAGPHIWIMKMSI